MSMFGSIAQSAREDRLVLTLSASSDNTIKFWDVNSASNVLYEYEKVGDPSVKGSGELLNGPYLTDISVPSGGNYKLYIRPSGSNYTYSKRMSLRFGSVSSNAALNNTQRDRILSVDNWGNYPLYYNTVDAFYLCPNFDILASDCPLLRGSTDTALNASLYRWFQTSGIKNNNHSLKNWEIRRVKTLQLLFVNTLSLDGGIDLGDWDISGLQSSGLQATFYGNPLSCSLATKYVKKYGREYIAWDTENITNLDQTFRCISLSPGSRDITINGISNWNTSNVTAMRGTFMGTYSQNSYWSKFNPDLDLSTKQVTVGAGTSLEKTYNAWDVSKVTIFGHDASVNHAWGTFAKTTFNSDISNWQINTSSAVIMHGMFMASKDFNQPITGSMVTVGSNTYKAWDVSAVTDFRSMFRNDYYAYNTMSFNQPIGEWGNNTRNVESLTSMFLYHRAFNQDLSKWNTSNVTSLSNTFRGTSMQYDLSSSYQNNNGNPYIAWDTSKVTTMFSTFANNLANTYHGVTIDMPGYNGDITNWNTDSLIDLRGTFAGGTLVSSQTASFNQDISTKQVTVGAGTSLETTYNAWNMENCYRFGRFNDDTNTSWDAYGTFHNNRHFNQPIGNWQINTSSAHMASGLKVSSMRSMFTYNDVFNQPLSESIVTVGSKTYRAWDIRNIGNFRKMFNYSKVFNQDISNWNMSSSRNLSSMFALAESFDQDLSKWNTMNATDMGSMFHGTHMTADLSSSYQPATSNRNEYIAWDTRNVTSMGSMFRKINPTDSSNIYPGYDGDITNWDTSNVTNMAAMFSSNVFPSTNTASFNQNISTKPITIAAGTSLQRTYNAWDVSSVETFGNTPLTDRSGDDQLGMFSQNHHFNQPIGNWQINTGSDINVSLKSMFRNAKAFNQDISSSIVTVGSKTYTAWDTKRVYNLYGTFELSNFNKPIGNWNLSNVLVTRTLFENNTVFNQDISASIQTVGSETYNAWYFPLNEDFSRTFNRATSFNKSISNWNITGSSTFQSMFERATGLTDASFVSQNVNLHGGVSYTSWDFSSNSILDSMFRYANNFEGAGLGTWDVSNVSSFGGFFAQDTNITTTNYDSILVGWSSSLSPSISLIHFGNATYTGTPGSAPSASHVFIEDDLGITLTDGGPI
jgi:surface protein